MSTLLKLEKDFLGCMLENHFDMADQVVSDSLAGAEERVWVYVEGYRLRLLEVLQDHFTGLLALLGDEEFDRMGRAYIDAHPSTHPSVRWFSRELPAFLHDTAPYAAQLHLAEMAAFEWAQSLVFDAADVTPLNMQALAEVPPDDWGRVKFQFHPSLQRLDLKSNMPKYWQALEAETALPRISMDEPASWALWRAELTTHWRSLSEDEAWMLDAARAGARFGELCEGLCRWHAPEGVAMQAASYLKLWLNDELITGIGVE